MKVELKKYKNDINKAYKALMKKLNQDGFYQELRKRDSYTPKSQQKRLAKSLAVIRERNRRKKQEQLFIKQDSNSYKSNKKNSKSY